MTLQKDIVDTRPPSQEANTTLSVPVGGAVNDEWMMMFADDIIMCGDRERKQAEMISST